MYSVGDMISVEMNFTAGAGSQFTVFGELVIDGREAGMFEESLEVDGFLEHGVMMIAEREGPASLHVLVMEASSGETKDESYDFLVMA